MFEDNIGTYYDGGWHPEAGVYDKDIFPWTWYGKTFFAFINSCLSANLTYQGYGTQGATGLPYAFTHGRMVVDREQTAGFNVESHMSDDAYFYPDNGSQIFIGFPWGSASLSQPIPYSGGTHKYSEWVDKFFDTALRYDVSVNDALDHASFELYGMYFANPYVPLRGFTAHWDGMPNFQDCSIAVYGNGRLRLKSFGDNFDDRNYNGWTVTLGSWSASTQKLRSQGQSLIRTNQQFTTDRYVRVQAKTLIAGPENGDVAWVMPKFVDFNNMVSVSLRKDNLPYLKMANHSHGKLAPHLLPQTKILLK
jgi:hypothetical protein